MRILTVLIFAAAMLVAAAPTTARITKAPAQATKRAIKVETMVTGLVHPWGLAFLPEGRLLVTERPGRMRIISKDGKLSEPLRGVPAVYTSEEGGSMSCSARTLRHRA
jgi:glucose/arabinose dehydrogenase